MPVRKLRSRRHNPDVDAFLDREYGGMESMAIFELDFGPIRGTAIPAELLPGLIERFRDQLVPRGWAMRQVAGEGES